MEKYPKAIKILKRLIRESPDNPDLHRELFIAYRSQKKYARCRQILERLIMLDRSDNSIYALALSIGEKDLADRYHKESTYRYYAPATCSNYQELAKRVLAKRIKLVCMQYPLRSIGPLKAVLCQYKGILFVDNEKTFRDALLASDYDSLFRDQFAPDFGHCTDHGNKLIAENLADTIIKEVEH
jgi:tetratricopeptide (TPR) repeat protein